MNVKSSSNKTSLTKQLLTKPSGIFAEIAKEKHSSALFWQLLLVGLLTFFVYGFIAGTFVPGLDHWLKIGVKALVLGYGVPLLSLSSLYVFLALQGSHLSLRQVILLLFGKIATMGIVLAGLLPIAWFFTFSSLEPGFAEAMHFFIWLLAALFGYIFLVRGVNAIASAEGKKEDGDKTVQRDASGLRMLVLLIWGGVYLLVFGRLVWLMQPFFETYEGFLL